MRIIFHKYTGFLRSTQVGHITPGGKREVVIKDVEKIINENEQMTGVTPDTYLK
jgi:hypothetical protein